MYSVDVQREDKLNITWWELLTQIIVLLQKYSKTKSYFEKYKHLQVVRLFSGLTLFHDLIIYSNLSSIASLLPRLEYLSILKILFSPLICSICPGLLVLNLCIVQGSVNIELNLCSRFFFIIVVLRWHSVQVEWANISTTMMAFTF